MLSSADRSCILYLLEKPAAALNTLIGKNRPMNPEKPFPGHSEVTSSSQAPSPIGKRQSVPKVMAMPLAVPAEVLISQSILLSP